MLCDGLEGPRTAFFRQRIFAGSKRKTDFCGFAFLWYLCYTLLSDNRTTDTVIAV